MSLSLCLYVSLSLCLSVSLSIHTNTCTSTLWGDSDDAMSLMTRCGIVRQCVHVMCGCVPLYIYIYIYIYIMRSIYMYGGWLRAGRSDARASTRRSISPILLVCLSVSLSLSYIYIYIYIYIGRSRVLRGATATVAPWRERATALLGACSPALHA
jgi:hypothetical protein